MSALAAGGCLIAVCLATEADETLKCAGPDEVAAIRTVAIQQALMDAALTCGGEARNKFNAFQTNFGSELRSSDDTLLRMFKRVLGNRQGDDAYNLFKTNVASRAELRRLANNRTFCMAADRAVTAALAADKPELAQMAKGVLSDESQPPVESCGVLMAKAP